MPSPISFPQLPRPLRAFLRPLSISAEGMARQQAFLEVIAKNIANAQTTRTPEGGPYKREVAVDGAQGLEAVQDSSKGRVVYDPGHPDADADGFVEYPNVDIDRELVDLMIARRVHEANNTVFHAAKNMLKRALEI
ncbi:MAG TPA: flagellar basal body rod protein FlgC [Myxococcales bacterium]|nr:flagellar basal body rod protein FlgC [Myxococcales bacterium]